MVVLMAVALVATAGFALVACGGEETTTTAAPTTTEAAMMDIVDTAVAFEAYKNGELDIVDAVGEDLPTIEADPTLKSQLMIYPGACTILIKFGLAAIEVRA